MVNIVWVTNRPRTLLSVALLAACATEPPDAGATSGTYGPPPKPKVSSAKPLGRVPPPFDPTSTAAMIDQWPRIVPGAHARSVTGFDRSGGNADGFGGTYSVRYVDERGEQVIFDERGPGVLRTLWFTSAIDGNSPLGLGPLRFYFDDEDTPRLEVDADALFGGKMAPFVEPLVASNARSTGGFASWAPLPFRARLRVTTSRRPGFVQLHHDVFPPDWDIASYVPGTTDTATIARFIAGTSSLPLEEVPLETTRAGAGIVDVLRFVPAAPVTDAALARARIVLAFDGAPTPQVDVPLPLFFGSARGVAPVLSVAWTMQSSLFESRLPMPFWNGVRFAVTGLPGKLYIHVGPQRWTPAEAGHLEVRVHEEETSARQDFVYADSTGTGKIVATVLGVDPERAENKQWWEGDLRTCVDDSRSPSIHGTGHEDDHLGGWSNEFLLRSFSLPMQGAPRTDIYDPDPKVQINGATTLYRLWPGIPFYRSIRHSTEHGTGNGRTAHYAAATFLYRQAKARLVPTDHFDLTNVGRTSELTSAFEGEDATELTATVHTFEEARFSLAIDPTNEGVELRRWFDRSEVPAQANLEVDGVLIGSVTSLGPVAETRRWAEEDTFVPAQVTRGKSRIDVRWVSATTSTAVRFEAWSVVP